MKELPQKVKLIWAVVIVIASLLIGGGILIFNQDEISKINKTNLYINDE